MLQEFSIVLEHKDRLLIGLGNTIWISVISTILSTVIGAGLAIALMSKVTLLRRSVRVFIDAMRCVPFLLLAYIVYYGLPSLGLRFDNVSSGIASLALYNAAYMGEILRGAWVSLPKEYAEAGEAYGFHGFKLFYRIIMPSLVLAAVPVLGNQVIQIVKDTAFLTIIAVPELTHEASAIQSMYYVPFGAFVAAIALYWLICRAVEFAVQYTEHLAEIRR